MKQALRFRVVAAALGLGSAVAFGCYTGPGAGALPDPGDGVDPTDPGNPGHGNGRDGGNGHSGEQGDASVQTPRGMPCEVAAVVAANCMECHGAVPSGGAPNRLLTYEDFSAKPSDPSFASVAALALSRMKSSSRPMPPSGQIDADSLSVFEGWVNQGLPRGTCADHQGDDDDGGANDPPGDDDDDGTGDPPPPSQCTNGMLADAGAPGELMRPGEACITCHNANEGPLFEAGGTIYPTMHEPDDCAGATGTKVLLIDGTGFVHSLEPNTSGNFYFEDQLPRPYRALVVRGRNLKEMETPQWNGDCNSCHTERGTSGAPGRISIP